LAASSTPSTPTPPPNEARCAGPARDHATLALLAGCGLRASEICALTWQRLIELDVAGDARIVVRGKRRRIRIVPLSTAAVLQAYRDERTLRAKTASALKLSPRRAVIVQTDGRALTPAVLDRWLTHWLAAEVARRPGAAAHAFRHTAADGWLNNGATLAEVQALLGHASIATIGVYTKARTSALIDVVRNGRYERH
jgi:site-specific recombinase XerD